MKFSVDRLSASPVLVGKELSDGSIDGISDDTPLPVNNKFSVTRYSNSGSVTANTVILTFSSAIDAQKVLLAISVSTSTTSTLTLVVRRSVLDSSGNQMPLTSSSDETYTINVTSTPTLYVYQLSRITDVFRIEASATASTNYAITAVVLK